MDLVRNTADPQVASKILVDHALARFSTDNLSCMIVRFDNRALQQTVDRKIEPIGVEGDPPVKKGGISEADAIIKEARKSMSDSSTLVPDEASSEERSISQDAIREEEGKEVGPELDPHGVKAVGEAMDDNSTA